MSTTGSVHSEAVLRDVARELLDDLEARAREIAERIHAQMPEFGPRAAVTAQTTDAVRAVIAAFARGMLRGETPGVKDVPVEATRYAHAFVHHRIAMPLLIRIYRLGHAELWRLASRKLDEYELNAADAGTARAALEDTLFAYIDAITQHLIEEYEAERERWVRSPAARRLEIVEAILAGEPVDEQAVEPVLRYPLDLHHVGLALWIDVPDPQDDPLEQLQHAVTEVIATAQPAGSLVVPVGQHVIWAWLGAREDATCLLERLEGFKPGVSAVRLAIGEPGTGATGFRASHQGALATRRLAILGGQQAPYVTRARDVAVLALLAADTERARSFVTDVLGRLDLESDSASRLRETLLAYLQERDRGRAAEALRVHLNTVAYRLRQCEELLGRSVHERRFETEAALRLRQDLGLSLTRPAPSR